MTPLKELDAPDIAEELVDQHPQLEDAITLATTLHEGQRRGPRMGREAPPYIEHPLRVSARLARAGVTDLPVLSAAVLHDTVEDCEARLAQLAGCAQTREAVLQFLGAEFGKATASVVHLLTNPETGGYLQPVKDAVSKDPRALLVKTSDWLDNAGSLHHTPKLAPRLSVKYRPLTEILLEQLDAQHVEVQQLLHGRLDELRKRVLRAGFRLEVLSRRQHPSQ